MFTPYYISQALRPQYASKYLSDGWNHPLSTANFCNFPIWQACPLHTTTGQVSSKKVHKIWTCCWRFLCHFSLKPLPLLFMSTTPGIPLRTKAVQVYAVILIWTIYHICPFSWWQTFLSSRWTWPFGTCKSNCSVASISWTLEPHWPDHLEMWKYVHECLPLKKVVVTQIMSTFLPKDVH